MVILVGEEEAPDDMLSAALLSGFRFVRHAHGRGIPVDLHPTEKLPAVEVALTVLHAGGKFDNKSYAVSGGLHGVGVSCVNFLSEWLKLEIWRDGKTHEMEFQVGIPVAPLAETGKTTKRGTKITFKPDTDIFESTVYSFDKLSERLREKAFLNKGIRIFIKDEREEPEKSHEFYYKGGIAEFADGSMIAQMSNPDMRLPIQLALAWPNRLDAGIEPASVDTVYCLSTLEHVPGHEATRIVEYAATRLRPGGHLVLTVDLFLNLAPFSRRTRNDYGWNHDIRGLVEASGLHLSQGDRSELHGFDEFDAQDILGRLDEFLVGSYPAVAQALVLTRGDA